MRWGWKRLFTNTVNMKRNIRAIMSFRVFTPIFLIKVPFLPEWMVGWMKERWVDDTSEATHTRGGTWTKAGITNEQHPLIYHICSFFSGHDARSIPIRSIFCEREERYEGARLQKELSHSPYRIMTRWLWWQGYDLPCRVVLCAQQSSKRKE